MSEGSRPDQPSSQSRRSLGVVGATMLVLVSVLVAIFAIGALYLALGFPVDAAQQLQSSRAIQATLQAQNTTFQLQNAAMQTQVAELERRSSTSREQIDSITNQLAELGDIRAQIIQNDMRNATVIAEARESRDAVRLYATAEASRAALLNDLQRRSERLERFLQRLSDISSDAALDLNNTPADPTVTVTSPAITATIAPTELIPSATATPTARATTTATAAAATSSPTATPQP